MFVVKITDYDKRVHEEEINEFVPKNIVDAHTHVYPLSLKSLEKVWDIGRQGLLKIILLKI